MHVPPAPSPNWLARFRQVFEDRLAKPMFVLSLLVLIVSAALTHRIKREDVRDEEIWVYVGILLTAWPVFVAEAWIRYLTRDAGRGGRPFWIALLHSLVPPFRLAARSYNRDDQVWLPKLGWRQVDDDLRQTLERFFSIPLLMMALMIVPLLVIEVVWGEGIRADYPGLALALDLSEALIWLAFAIELVIMLTIAENRWLYAIRNWIDVVIVLLPVVDALPLLRVLRVGRLARIQQLSRMTRMYRLRSLAVKAWRAIVLLRFFQAIFRRPLEKELERLERQMAQREKELARLRDEIDRLKKRIGENAPDPKPAEMS